jgi:hypothetical protein
VVLQAHVVVRARVQAHGVSVAPVALHGIEVGDRARARALKQAINDVDGSGCNEGEPRLHLEKLRFREAFPLLTMLLHDAQQVPIVGGERFQLTKEDAERAVKSALYPPAGQRSFGPVRVGARDGRDYFANANERVAVIPMIETVNALAEVESIVSLPGVDGVFMGPYDLSLALGLRPGDNDGQPAFDSAVAKVLSACKKAGKCAAMLSNENVAPLRAKQGFQMISVTTDINALATASASSLNKVRAAIGTS